MDSTHSKQTLQVCGCGGRCVVAVGRLKGAGFAHGNRTWWSGWSRRGRCGRPGAAPRRARSPGRAGTR
eukprot:1782199-Rhodomonas_salina.2